MDHKEFEQKMRSLEIFHTLKLVPEAWTIIRVDGRSFSHYTEEHYNKPFDEQFHQHMVQTATTLISDLNGIYAFTESDEISVLLPRSWDLFDREVEKIVSISASIASVAFTLASGHPVQFDSRIISCATNEQVIDYFRWRQEDGTRCGLNGWCYWTLRKDGQSARVATTSMHKMTVAAKNELLFQHGINFNDLPAWQRHGVGIRQETYEKEGFDPIQQCTVTALRHRYHVDSPLPIKQDYADYIQQIIQ
jgi:tRNA(His) guanylyltransferase